MVGDGSRYRKIITKIRKNMGELLNVDEFKKRAGVARKIEERQAGKDASASFDAKAGEVLDFQEKQAEADKKISELEKEFKILNASFNPHDPHSYNRSLVMEMIDRKEYYFRRVGEIRSKAEECSRLSIMQREPRKSKLSQIMSDIEELEEVMRSHYDYISKT